jgi:hypothetical protein
MGRLSMSESLTGPKVPGREEAVNDGPKTARRGRGPEHGFGGGSLGRAARGTGHANSSGERGNSLAAMGWNP